MSRYLTIRFDVTTLTQQQVNTLRFMATTQAEAHGAQYKDDSYPDVKVAEVCHFCAQVIEDGECGGEGEGNCTELLCVSSFNPTKHPDAETYVVAYCKENRIEDALVPYRNDGLTYYQQLAYLVREYHDLPHPKKFSRRLP